MRHFFFVLLLLILSTAQAESGSAYVAPTNNTASLSTTSHVGDVMNWVGDSITGLGGGGNAGGAGFTITSTTAGNSYFLVTTSSPPATFDAGDSLTLCNSNCTVTENVTIPSSYQGPLTTYSASLGGWVIPVSSPLQNSGETSATPFFGRAAAASYNNWPHLAVWRMGGQLSIGGYTNYLTTNCAPYSGSTCPQRPDVSGIFGLAGATCEQIDGLAPYLPSTGQNFYTTIDYVQAALSTNPKPHYVHLLCGTNDVSKTTIFYNGNPNYPYSLSITESTITHMLQEVVLGGAVPVLGTIPPASSDDYYCSAAQLTDAGQNNRMQLNNWIRQYAKTGITVNGVNYKVIVADYFRALADPNTQKYGNAGPMNTSGYGGRWGSPAKVTWSTDCVHPGTFAGAWQMTNAFVDAMSPYLPVISHPAGEQYAVNNPSNIAWTVSPLAGGDAIYSTNFGNNPGGNDVPNGGLSPDQWETVTIGGTAGTGNALSITLTSASLTGSPITLSYTTVAGDTTSTVANQFAALINQNANLIPGAISGQTDGVVAVSADNVVYVTYPQGISITWTKSVAGSWTITEAAGTGSAGTGTNGACNTNSGDVQGICPTGWQVYCNNGGCSGTATPSITNKSSTPNDYLDRGYWLNFVSSGNNTGVATTNDVLTKLPSQYVASGIITNQSMMYLSTRIKETCNTDYQLQPNIAVQMYGYARYTPWSGTPAAGGGDILAFTLTSAQIPGGSETVNYTTQAGDTLTIISKAIAVAIDADPVLSAMTPPITASSSGANLYIYEPGTLVGTLTPSLVVSGGQGGTESISGSYDSPISTFTYNSFSYATGTTPADPNACLTNAVLRSSPFMIPRNISGMNIQLSFTGSGTISFSDVELRNYP